jgi:ferrous iron transport protein A
MKTLYELKKNEKTKVKTLHSRGVIRERLVSFGIVRDAEIEVKNCNLSKDNIEISVNGNSFIALRSEEAKSIEII